MSQEYEVLQAPKEAPFWSFPKGDESWHKFRVVREIGDSEEYTVGKGKKERPAKVFLVEVDRSDYRLTMTSSRLQWCFDQVKAKFGTYTELPFEFEIRAVGNDTERTFEVRWPKDAKIEQTKLTG